MKEVTLFIAGQRADTAQGEDLSINIAIEGTQPGSIQGAHSSRTFALPATKANHAIFQHLDEARSTSDKQKQLDAVIEVNGVPVSSGKVQVQQVEMGFGEHGLKATKYRTAFVGNNADWFQAIGGTLVRSLSWGDVELTKVNYDALCDANPATDETCFSLIKWKAWELEDAVQYTELTPCLSLRQIFLKGFQSIGYKFVSCFDEQPFSRLVVPVPLALDGDYIKQTINAQASLASLTVTSPVYTTVIFDDDSTPPNYDTGNNYDTTTGKYTAPKKALYSVIVSWTADFGSLNPGQNEVYIKINGTVKETYVFEYVGVHSFEWLGDLEAGDEVEVEWYPQQYGGVDPFVSTSDWLLTIEAEKEGWSIGETLEYDYIIPGTWFVKDFIQDVTRVFNLAWETDVTGRTVYAYPKDRYTLSYRNDGDGAATSVTREGFFRTSGATDVTRRVDVTQGGEWIFDTSQVQDQVLAWGTGDVTTENLEKKTASNLYSARYRFPDGRYPAGSNWAYTTYFAKTLHIQDTAISSGGLAVQVPLLYGEDYYESPDAKPDYTINPKLLYFGGQRGGQDGYVRVYDPDTSANTPFAPPMAFQVNYNDASGSDWSLSFSDEVTNFGYPVKGLMKTFHLQTLKRMEVGRKLTAFTLWNDGEIGGLSFRNPISLNGDRYLLQAIEGYSLVNRRTAKTVLYLDAAPTTADASNVIGPVLLEGAAPNGLTQLGAITGQIGAGQTMTRIRYHQLINPAGASNVITLPASSGLLAVANVAVALKVFQNGQRKAAGLEYTVSGLDITIDSAIHYEGCIYEIIIQDVV